MTIIYAREKFYLAVEHAATSTDSLQQRLCDAFSRNIDNVQREGLTQDLWVRVMALKRELNKKPAKGNEGTIMATTAEMTDEEATSALVEIVSIFGEICKLIK